MRRERKHKSQSSRNLPGYHGNGLGEERKGEEEEECREKGIGAEVHSMQDMRV